MYRAPVESLRKGRGKGRGPTLRSRAYSFPACSPHVGGREGLRSLRPKGAVGGFHPNGRERAAPQVLEGKKFRRLVIFNGSYF
jgi:hypothetical protein